MAFNLVQWIFLLLASSLVVINVSAMNRIEAGRNYAKLLASERSLSLKEATDLMNLLVTRYDLLRQDIRLEFINEHKKLKTIYDTVSNFTPEFTSCLRILNELDRKRALVISNIHLKDIVDKHIADSCDNCRSIMNKFLANLADQTDQTALWSKLKRKINLGASLESSLVNVGDMSREAFKDLVQNEASSDLVDRSVQIYLGASQAKSDVIFSELFGMFSGKDCKFIELIEALLIADPSNYVGANAKQREVVEKLIAYCAIKGRKFDDSIRQREVSENYVIKSSMTGQYYLTGSH